jgi:hypothetical protein
LTTEVALLLGGFGLAFLAYGRWFHDRNIDDRSGILSTAPSGRLRRLTRGGEGPVRAVSLAWEIYGTGLFLLSAAVVVTGASVPTLAAGTILWWMGGIVPLGIVDAITSAQGWFRRRRSPDS